MAQDDWKARLAALPADQGVFVAGGCGCPTALLQELAARPELLAGRRVITSFLPGINGDDPTTGADTPPVETMFPLAALGPDRQTLVPLSYAAFERWLTGRAKIGLCLFQAARGPAAQVNLGLAADYVPALAAAGVPLVAQVNPGHPALPGAPVIAVDHEVTSDTPLPRYDTGPIGDTFARIGAHIAGLIMPGDTVQVGLGKVQPALFNAIAERGARVTLHGGMLSTAALRALDEGCITRIRAGILVGNDTFYARAPQIPDLHVLPVSQTHSRAALAPLDSFVAVNAALAVDLAGQATSESVNGRTVSAAGGLADFHPAALDLPGGRAILALPATAKGQSRIVPTLPQGTRVTVTAANADIVVTEHGVAHLRGRTLTDRARALAAIAAPEHRDALLHTARTA